MRLRYLKDDRAASSAEYALILAVVGVGLGAATVSLGANIRASINKASTDVYAQANPVVQGDGAGYASGTAGSGITTAGSQQGSTSPGVAGASGGGVATNPGCSKGNGKKGC